MTIDGDRVPWGVFVTTKLLSRTVRDLGPAKIVGKVMLLGSKAA